MPESAYGEPGRYYPAGVRNYFRVVASDDLQGAGQAVLAHALGLRRVYLLTTGRGSYGPTVADGIPPRRRPGRGGRRRQQQLGPRGVGLRSARPIRSRARGPTASSSPATTSTAAR